MSSIWEVDGNRLRLHLHPGQTRAWDSKARIVALIAGTQSGKTSFMPPWLWREIKDRGPGDYAVVTPTFSLLELKALPEFRRFFEASLQLGSYVGSPVRRFTFSESGCRRMFGTVPGEPTQVFFGYAENPESLESATYKAVVCDEAGQAAFRAGSWEALQRRLAIHRGRCLITTTPYRIASWLKREVFDRWKAGDPDIEVVNFSSTMNPAFPPEEAVRAKALLPAWKYALFYEGRFSRPAGLIYDAYQDELAPRGHVIPRFALPARWPRFVGLDFGNVNMAAVFVAAEPGTDRLYVYRTYHTGGRSDAQHVEAMLRGEPCTPVAIGGAKSEDEWREKFAGAGLPVRCPSISDVEVGINSVYAAFRRNELLIFDDLEDLRDDLTTYSREVDDRGEPTEKIEDKNTFHILDSLRYLISELRPALTHGRPVAGGTRETVAAYQQVAPAAGARPGQRSSQRNQRPVGGFIR